jgi:hypothetical protein
VSVYKRLMNSDNEQVALKAAQSLSEWSLGRPREADTEDADLGFDARTEAWILRVLDAGERERAAEDIG